MNRYFIALMTALIIVTACGKGNGALDPEPEPDPEPVSAEFNVASFNIRLDTEADTDYKDWSARKENCAAVVKNHSFDVFGLQEVLYNQQIDLKALLPDYGFYFVGRDNGSAGEAVGVAYNTRVFEIVDWNRFWLSDTPDIPSNSVNWGGMTRKRVAAWVLLRHKESGKTFYFLATHLEVNNNGVSYAGVREKSARLIIEKMKSINEDGLPLFVVGDMNPEADDEAALEAFRSEYHDSFRVAQDGGFREGPKATYQAFDPSRNLDKASSHPFDFIFYTDPVELKTFAALTDTFGGYYPSDHLPVVAKVKL